MLISPCMIWRGGGAHDQENNNPYFEEKKIM